MQNVSRRFPSTFSKQGKNSISMLPEIFQSALHIHIKGKTSSQDTSIDLSTCSFNLILDLEKSLFYRTSSQFNVLLVLVLRCLNNHV